MIDQTRIHEFSGNHHEMGLKQGRTFESDIAQTFQKFKNLEEVKGLKPRGLPTNLFMKFASKKASKFLIPLLSKEVPNQLKRLRGISEGANMNEDLICLFSAAELLLGDLDWELPHLKTGCTSIAYKSSKTEEGHAFISRNFDYARFIQPYLVLRKNSPKDLNNTFDLTAMVLPGTFNGLNEHGVYIATDEAFPISERDEGLSASIIIQEALETCQSTGEVVKFFSTVPRGSGNVILVADPTDDIRVIEYTSKRIHQRLPNKGDDFIVATNHYNVPELKSIDIPRNAVFGHKAPKSLWGVCINETSHVRKELAEKKLRKLDKIAVDFMQSLHRDHSASADNRGGMETICHHDPANISAASMIVDLETFDSWICFGLPCENEYKNFKVRL